MKNCFILFVVGLTASIQTAPTIDSNGSLSFDNAHDIIFSRNLGLKSIQTEEDAARAGVAQAGVFPNPEVELLLDNFGINELEAGIGQTIELGNKRKLRTEAAHNEVDAAVNLKKLTELELETEIIRRFILIVITGHKLEVIDSIISITQSTRDQIQRRIDAGGSRMTDLFQIEIDIEQLQQERSELHRKNNQARLKFAALGSERDTVLINVSGDLEEITTPDLPSLHKAIENNPVIIAYTIEKAKLKAEERLLNADAIPDLNLSAGYLRNNIERYNSPLLGVSMSIPLFNKNTAAQNQVKLKQKAIEEQANHSHWLLLADVDDIHSQLQSTDRRIQTLLSSIIPKTQRVYTMLQEYYNAGNAGFIDLAAAQAEMLHLKLELLDIKQERALAFTDLMQKTATTYQIVKQELK